MTDIRIVQLVRDNGKRTNDLTIESQIDFLITRAFAAGRGKGWKADFIKNEEPTQQPNGLWRFSYDVQFTKDHGKGDVDAQFSDILAWLVKVGLTHQQFVKYPWQVFVDGVEQTISGASRPTVSHLPTELPEITIHQNGYFDHIYDREAQIEIVTSAVQAAQDSKLRNRYHCLLFGEPGCGKTSILLALGNALGVEGTDYLILDATSLTQAGFQKLLLDADTVPPVIIIEEIEKTDESVLRPLLGIMDQRGEVRKTNARIGNTHREIKCLVLATVNDVGLFKRALGGALASRFSHEIYCPAPSQDVLRKILAREIAEVKGDEAWIEPTLEFAAKYSITDPRKVVPICLCGKEKLLDGSYQVSLEKVRKVKVL